MNFIRANTGTSKSQSVIELRQFLRQANLSDLHSVAGTKLLGFFSLLLTAYLVIFIVDDAKLREYANFIGPAATALVCFKTTLNILRRVPPAVWTPYFWLILNAGVFFGLGPLVPLLGNAVTRRSLAVGPFGVDALTLFRTNLLNCVGLFAAFAGFAIVSQFAWSRHSKVVKKDFAISIERLAFAFLVGGAVLRFGFILPYRFGATEFLPPGVSNLDHLFDLGLALSAFLAARGSQMWKVVLVVLWPIQIATCVLELSKFAVVMAIILPQIGAFLHHGRIRRLAITGVVACIVFLLFQPLVIAGRYEISSTAGSIHHASMGMRLEIVSRYLDDPQSFHKRKTDDAQPGLTRLFYNGVEGYVMKRYDAGVFREIPVFTWTVFIPRFLRGNTDHSHPGKELYFLVAGRRTCTLGLPVCADGYWQWGWPGAVFLPLVMGIVYAVFSKLALEFIASQQLIYLPVILLGMRAGMVGPTNFFVIAVASLIPVYVAYFLFASLCLRSTGD